jgi:hypothetical protein
MSNMPPPTPPGGQYPPASGSFPGAGQPFNPAFTPLPPIEAPKKKQRGNKPLFIGLGVVVLAALGAGAFLVFGRKDQAGNISSAKARNAVLDIADSAKLDNLTQSVLLKECPFDGVKELSAKAPKAFDPKDAEGGTLQAAVVQSSEKNDPELEQCLQISDDGKTLYGLGAAADPPTDLKAYLGRTLTTSKLKFDDTTKFRGGTLLPLCGDSTDASGGKITTCSTFWYDSKLMVGIAASGDGASTDVTTAWLKSELSNVVKILEQSATSVVVTDRNGFPVDDAAAASAFTAVMAGAPLTADTPRLDQASCPIIDLNTLVPTAPKAFDASSAAAGTIGGEISTAATDGDPSFIECSASTGSGTFGVLVAGVPSGDFNAYLKRSLSKLTLTIDDPVDFRGGTLHSYCAPNDDKTLFCETDWVSGSLQIGLFASGTGAVDADVTAWLEANLDALVASTASLTPDAIAGATAPTAG